MDALQKTCLLLALIVLSSGKLLAGDVDVEFIERLQEEARRQAERIQLPAENIEMKKEAEEVYRHVTSPEFQKRVEEQKKGAYELLTSKPYNETQRERKNTVENLPPDRRIYLFISSSMPVELLRTYAEQAERYGVSMIMRGFVGGIRKVRPTVTFISSIIGRDAGCNVLERQGCPVFNVNVLVDPLLFRRYDIKRVPAIVYVRGLGLRDPELSEGMEANITATEGYSVVYGDVSIPMALKIIQRRTNDNVLKKFIEGKER